MRCCSWSPDPAIGGGYYAGTTACLGCLYQAGRYEELLDLLDSAPYKNWRFRQWGVKALVALGRKADPRTLTRAARKLAADEPEFACGAGLAALRWLLEGYGYEITGADVWDAFQSTLEAAEKAGKRSEAVERLRSLLTGPECKDRFVSGMLERELAREEKASADD